MEQAPGAVVTAVALGLRTAMSWLAQHHRRLQLQPQVIRGHTDAFQEFFVDSSLTAC
jgi:hypothetical protein